MMHVYCKADLAAA